MCRLKGREAEKGGLKREDERALGVYTMAMCIFVHDLADLLQR